MRVLMRSLALTALLALVAVVPSFAQAPTVVSATTPAPNIVLIPISATNSVNTATTLTIPAPAGGLSNYVCMLAYQLNNDGTGTAVSNVVSTSTNFNSFAIKVSQPATASIDSGVMLAFQAQAAGGCAKSTIHGTATTFVSPTGVTHGAWTWYAVYFQAP